jgi:hypothetical protein
MDWMRQLKQPGKPWMLYLEVGLAAIVVVVVLVAYVVSRFVG